jgi:hypothetical protein
MATSDQDPRIIRSSSSSTTTETLVPFTEHKYSEFAPQLRATPNRASRALAETPGKATRATPLPPTRQLLSSSETPRAPSILLSSRAVACSLSRPFVQ